MGRGIRVTVGLHKFRKDDHENGENKLDGDPRISQGRLTYLTGAPDLKMIWTGEGILYQVSQTSLRERHGTTAVGVNVCKMRTRTEYHKTASLINYTVCCSCELDC